MDHATTKLISLVKSKPALYKFKAKKDKNKMILNQHWQEIALEMGCLESECKRKWAILRNCYARTLREERNQKCKRKPWYLQKKLSFLKKYIHPHQKLKSNLSEDFLPGHTNASQSDFCIDIDSSSSQPDVNQTLLTELSQCSAELFEPTPKPDCVEFPPVDSTFAIQNLVVNGLPTDETSNFSTITIKSSPKAKKELPADDTDEVTSNQEANSNHLFLTSLLPDLNKLSEKKQRVFKRKTIELLEILFEADEEFMANSKFYE